MPTTECPSNTTGDRLTHALGRAASGSCGRSTAGPGALPPRPGSASPRNAGRSARAQFAGSTTRSRSHTARVLAVHPPEHLPLLRVRQCPPSPGREVLVRRILKRTDRGAFWSTSGNRGVADRFVAGRHRSLRPSSTHRPGGRLQM